MKQIFTLLFILSFGLLFSNTLETTETETIACPTATIIYNGSPFCPNISTPQDVTITGTDNYTGGIYSATPGGLYLNPSTGAIIPSSSTPGIYTVTYTIPAGVGCPGFTTTTTVTIGSNATATIASNQTICAGDGTTITFIGTPGATISYNINGGANQVIILNSSGIATLNTGILTSTTVYNLVSVSSSIGCSTSLSASVTVTVNPTPTVTVNSPTVCSGSSATVTATPGTNGTYTYAWTVPAGAPNPGNVASFTTSIAGTYSVIISNTVTVCTSMSASGTVTVLPSLDITAIATNQSISSGDSTDISLSSNSTGATYQWTVTQNNITGATSGSGNTINQLLSLVNPALPGSVTYAITASMSGGACSRNITDITIMVNPNLGTDDFTSPNFIVSPNPVTDILNIKNNQTINKVTAFNQLGQMVLQKEYNNNEVQLDFSALKTGIYFISVDSDKKQSTFKIVKN